MTKKNKKDLPSANEFFRRKRYFMPKKDPIWVYLEKDLKKRPERNEAVEEWIKFLKDFHYFKWQQVKRERKRIESEVGPPWYCEFSQEQKQLLKDLRLSIHRDIVEEIPVRTRTALKEMGVSIKFSNSLLLNAMQASMEDPGTFIWILYTMYFKVPPSVLRDKYCVNSRILMSALVFIDEEECLQELDRRTKLKPKSVVTIPGKKKKDLPKEKDTPLSEYLQRPRISRLLHLEACPRKIVKPPSLENKIKLRSDESYERLQKNDDFLRKRRVRSRKMIPDERTESNYKYWEAPASLRNLDPAMVEYNLKLKMIREKAKPRHLKTLTNTLETLKFNLGTVCYSGGTPVFIINNIVTMQSGYIPLHNGIVGRGNKFIINIGGYWKYPRDTSDVCNSECDCMRWEKPVLTYLEHTKCKCQHFYDFGQEGRVKEKYFYQSTRTGQFWLDYAKIYNPDSKEDFIKETVNDALLSKTPTPHQSLETVAASQINEKELLSSFFADLSDTPLITPHLPKANLLVAHQEFLRNKLRGPRTPKQHQNLKHYSSRRWMQIDHMDFRARASFVPFTPKELSRMNMNHHHIIKKLSDKMLADFVKRSQELQLEQSRLLWRSMVNEAYPNRSFAQIYFTYMPARLQDTFVINPYKPDILRSPNRPCPLPK